MHGCKNATFNDLPGILVRKGKKLETDVEERYVVRVVSEERPGENINIKPSNILHLNDESSYCKHTALYTKVSVISCSNIMNGMPKAKKPFMWKKVLSLAHDFLHEGGFLVWWDGFYDVNQEITEMVNYMRSQRPQIRLVLHNKRVPEEIYDYLVQCDSKTEMRMLIWMRT
ncbi:MAG: hypothetical protein SGARI_001312 [Bacillariaceae sp.]